MTEKEVVQCDRSVLKRLVTAKLAGRDVDYVGAVKHETLPVPIALFKTDKSMRSGNKSALVNSLLNSSGVEIQNWIPAKPTNQSHHIVDLMFVLNLIRPLKTMKIFGEWSDAVCKYIYALLSDQIDIMGDRYDRKKSTKSNARKSRASKSAKKTTKKKIRKVAVEKVIDRETQLPANEEEWKLFLTLDVNKERIQLLVGTDLIDKAPANKTIVVSGVFEDRTDIRSNKLPQTELDKLQCDHEEADTRIVRSAVLNDLPRSVILANDTDVLVSLLSNLEKAPHGKELYMRRAKHDILDVRRIGQGLIRNYHLSLPSLGIFHPLTGDDQNCFMHNRGKVICWDEFLKHHVSILQRHSS